MTALSTIICTHNPRPDYLRRVLDALRGQTLPEEQWELLLIDNASTDPLAGRVDLSWHPRARIIREDEVGLSYARARGIAEFEGELLLFVDDDNVLEPDYLQACLEIARERAYLGAWGGSCRPEYEIEVPAAVRSYLGQYIAVSEIERDLWSNLTQANEARPFGAGLCVRREVALAYLAKFQRDPLRRALGRRGRSLGAGEDDDIALTAVGLDFGTGRFPALRLTHLISKDRLTEDYVVRLLAGLSWTDEIMHCLYPQARHVPHPVTALLKYWYYSLIGTPIKRKILRASRRAQKEARELMARLQHENREKSPEET